MQSEAYGSRSDTELAARTAAGDEQAFAALYGRHFDGIYDFVLRTVKDPELAADVIGQAFAKAWDRSRKRNGRHNVKAWLYAIARERAVRVRSRGPFVVDSGDPPADRVDWHTFAQADSSEGAVGEPDPIDAEAAALVWEFAARLSPQQYSLLDLHLRRGLRVDDLAQALGFTMAKIYVMLYRLRGSLVESLSTVLLARRGRSQCRELEALLSEIRFAEDSSGYQRSVLKHLEACMRCQASRATFPSALAAFANLAPLAPPQDEQAAIWGEVSAHINGISPYRRARALEPRDRTRQRLGVVPFPAKVPVPAVLAAGIASIVAILVAGILIFGTGGGGASTARDPGDVHSINHKIGEPSSDNTIDLAWTAISGAKAYSTMWSHLPADLPDTVADLPGSATSTTSPPLDPGTWYFHLRTQDEDDSWTSTLHVGPFEIIAASPTPSPATPAASPTQTVTPPPPPRFPTQAPPEPTPTDTPAPTPQPTPSPPPPTPTATPAPGSPTITISPPVETP